MQQQAENFDAIVVGSGISGGWAAKELTERGLRVLLLERGKNIEHQKDYPNARKGPWEYPHRAGRTRAMIDAYPVLQRDYPLNEKNLDWWVNEQESPYTEVKRFDWYRGYHVGGRSLTWGRQSYRLSDLDFEANSREGIAVDWPIRYADLAPWYDHVEKHAGIAGSIEKLPQLPDGQFQPAMPLNCAEETIAGRLAKQFGGHRRIIPGRNANLTQPLPGRGRCQYRNACALGCPSGSYFSTQASTLPFAMATGRLTMKTHRDRDRRGLRPQSPPRDRRARDRRADQRHHRVHRARGLPVRVDAQLDVAADAFGHRRVAGRPRQQQRRARSQPDGPPLPVRRQRRDRRAPRQERLRPPADRLLHSALPESLRRQARLPARLRLPGQREPPGVAARGRRARRRRGVQGRRGHAWPVADGRHRVRRDAAEPRQPDLARSGEEGQVGPAGPGHRLRDRRKRTADAAST